MDDESLAQESNLDIQEDDLIGFGAIDQPLGTINQSQSKYPCTFCSYSADSPIELANHCRKTGHVKVKKPRKNAKNKKPESVKVVMADDGAELGKGFVVESDSQSNFHEDSPTKPTILADGIFKYLLSLPADAFMIFNKAKSLGFENHDKIFDEWIYDCILARLEYDYGIRFVVVPIAAIQQEDNQEEGG